MALYSSTFVFSLAITLDWWHIGMNTITKPATEQWYMNHIMHTSQCRMLPQIQMISHFPSTFSHNEWSHRMVPKFPSPMQPQVLCRQQDCIANCILNMSSLSVSILLLICLHLWQTMLHQLTKFLPTLYLILHSLNWVQCRELKGKHNHTRQWLADRGWLM